MGEVAFQPLLKSVLENETDYRVHADVNHDLPLVLTRPETLFISPSSTESSELLPEPTAPTTATSEPFGMFMLMLRRVGSGSSPHEKWPLSMIIGLAAIENFFSSATYYILNLLFYYYLATLTQLTSACQFCRGFDIRCVKLWIYLRSLGSCSTELTLSSSQFMNLFSLWIPTEVCKLSEHFRRPCATKNWKRKEHLFYCFHHQGLFYLSGIKQVLWSSGFLVSVVLVTEK